MPIVHPVSTVRSQLGTKPWQRAAAFAALVADVLGLGVLFLLAIAQPLLALVIIVVAIAILVTSFAALLTHRPTRLVLAAISVALVVTEVLLVILWPAARGLEVWVIPAALALLAGGVALERYALNHGPGTLPVTEVVVPTGRAHRRSVLFVNPRSGGGKAAEFGLVELAQELGVQAVVLEPDDNLEALARRAAEDGAEVLGMAGGDGSQACVLGIAAEHDLPFVCIPSGTRNHFALELGLDRRDPRPAMGAFIDSEPRRIDYGTVNGRVFVNNVALGLYAAIVEQDGYRDAKVQTTLDLLPQLAEAGGPWFDLQYEVPGQGPQTGSTLLLVSNNPYELSGGSIQRRRLDGGELGIIAFNAEGLRDLVGITLLTAAGRPEAARSLWRWEAPTLTVDSPHAEVVAGIDGETVHLEPPLELAVVHCGATVLVPRGSLVGLDEQRASGSARFVALLEVAFQPPAGDD
jgi:diacylglycerol kinase family enzyme